MSDAVAAARARIDRALSALEHRIEALKSRTVTRPMTDDDDLFAIPATTSGTSAGAVEAGVAETALRARVAELEAAGREASEALSGAIEHLRGLIDAPSSPGPAEHEEQD